MRHDVDVQTYRDFAENLGEFSVGAKNIAIYKTDGSLSGYLDFSMPDFGMVATYGYSTLVAPSYVASVRHNTGYKTLKFGNGAQYAANYTLINRNESTLSDIDFHLPRLNKVVTESAPASVIEKSDMIAADKSRYSWYTRIGGGTQSQVNEAQTEQITLSGAYNWVSGGTINAATVKATSGSLQGTNYGPDNPLTSPLSIGTMGGDSGSPVMVYDELEQVWKVAGVLHGAYVTDQIYGQTSIWEYIPDNYIQTIAAANTSPDVVDVAGGGAISWDNDAIRQNTLSWSWSGLDTAYAGVAPSGATNEELDATKDLRFNGAGGLITLNAPINMGAGKLQFSNNYTVASASGANATWAGGGVEVDAGKEVLWQVNGVANDALHKIGAGTLHVNAEGNNPGSLNVGDGTVVLDQRADANGDKSAFSSVTLVSGRPTVVLSDENQVGADNIYFGYRGGRLDLNGNALTFKKINHTDSGALLVNHNSDLATLNITGYTAKDVPFNTFSGSNPTGTPGSIYVYNNPYTKQTEYFQLNTSSYWYYPTDQSSTSTWTFLGTDADEAINHRLTQLNLQVFRGFIGEKVQNLVNGAMDVNISPSNRSAITALTGGMNLNGTLNANSGTTVLSGQPVAHAGSVVIEDDWTTSLFRADKIHVGSNALFQVGEYASVTADITADESARLSLGYNDSTLAEEKSWRCYAVIYKDDVSCSQPVRDADALARLPASEVTGDVQLANDASLYLGKVNYQGAVSSSGTTRMTLDSQSTWNMTGNSHVSLLQASRGAALSTVPQTGWQAKSLDVDTLDATGLNLKLGVKPSTLESDKLTINSAASGSDNLLDVKLIVGSNEQVALNQDLVMIDAPAGTSHDYFSFASNYSGFSVYTPNYQVKDENDRVLWVLEHNQEQEPAEVVPETPAPAETVPEVVPETPAPAETVPEVVPETPAPAETVPEVVPETPAPAETAPEVVPETPAPAETVPEVVPETPAPAETAPEVVPETPAPAETAPEVVPETPAPAETAPEVVPETPAPAETAPEVVPETPAPAETAPEVVPETPAPAETAPEVVPETPAPAETAPEVVPETPAPAETAPEVAPETPAPAETAPAAEPETPAAAEAAAEEEAEKETPAEEPAAATEAEPVFNPDDWFTVYDNQPLIQNTRAMMASRQYIFSEAVSQLHQRTDSLRDASERSGPWVTIEQRKGGFLGLDASQQTLNVGWDKQSNNQLFGLSASYTQGQVEGKGKENHRLATVGAYYGWQSGQGWFVDAASRLMYLNQEITLDPALGINAQNRHSQMLVGSLRSGYQFGLAQDRLTISPYVGVSAGTLSGYSLKGQDVAVSLSSANPYFLTGGIMVKQRGLGAGLDNVNLFASIEYQYSPGKNGSKTTLSDRQSDRQYSAWSDNRYRSSVGIEGEISRNLSLNAKVDNSFGGVFKTDYSGQVGFSYHF